MNNRMNCYLEKGLRPKDFEGDVTAFINAYRETIKDGRITIPAGIRAKVIEKNGKKYFIQIIALLGHASVHVKELKDNETIDWCKEQGLL